MGRILGVDYGEIRIGLALSDKTKRIAFPFNTIKNKNIDFLLDFFRKSKTKKFKSFKLPMFNKAIDDRCKKNQWYTIKKRPDVVIFEGWCVGARAEKNSTIKKSINSLEKTNDAQLIWRNYVNKQLKTKYKKLYDQLDCLVYLKAKNFSLLQKWRLIQEKKLWLKNKNKKTNNYQLLEQNS